VDLLDVMIGIFASKLVGRRDIMHDTNHFHIVEAPKLYEKINYFNELQQQGNNAGIKWLKNECGALGLSFTAVVKGFKKGEDVGVTESRPIRLNTRESTEIIENI
jgi:hypothetical protein